MTYGLDLQGGLSLWTDELYGDWYRDPWSWPELQWLRKSLSKCGPEQYFRRTRGEPLQLTQPPRYHAIEVPKSQLGVRPAVVQDPLSRWLYLSAVSSSIVTLHADLPDFVYGWRSRGSTRPAPNGQEWQSYMERVREGEPLPAALQTDITSCFASIEIDRIMLEIFQQLGNTGPANVISQVLHAHNAINGRSGLPQRSFGSAALSNFFLSPIDELLSRATARKGVGVVARWMDDIVCFGDDATLYGLFLDIQQSMRALGLEANSSKSFLVTSSEAVEAIDLENGTPLKVRFQPGAGSGRRQRSPNPIDVNRLKHAESKILDENGGTRPAVKKILVSLRNAEQFDRWEEWLDIVQYIPHAADALGRYLRDAATHGEVDGNGLTWGELDEWLEDFFSQQWSRVHWVRAQLALSIPTENAGQRLLNIMENWLEQDTEVQLLAVAAQRLAERKPDVCRSIVSARAGSVADPLLQRILALAVLTTGRNRSLAQTLVRQDGSNSILGSALDDENWSAPPVSSDFEGGE